MLTAKLDWRAVCLNNKFLTVAYDAPRESSTTIRIPWRSDSSRKSEIPSIRFARTRSAIRSKRLALLTWYGSSVTISCVLPCADSSMDITARIVTRPRPVAYACRISA